MRKDRERDIYIYTYSDHITSYQHQNGGRQPGGFEQASFSLHISRTRSVYGKTLGNEMNEIIEMGIELSPIEDN